MKCPNCKFVSSNKRDVCPKCRQDLRPQKRALGIPVYNSKATVEELLIEYEEAAAQAAKAAAAAAATAPKKKRKKKKKRVKKTADAAPETRAAPEPKAVTKAKPKKSKSWFSRLVSGADTPEQPIEEAPASDSGTPPGAAKQPEGGSDSSLEELAQPKQEDRDELLALFENFDRAVEKTAQTLSEMQLEEPEQPASEGLNFDFEMDEIVQTDSVDTDQDLFAELKETFEADEHIGDNLLSSEELERLIQFAEDPEAAQGVEAPSMEPAPEAAVPEASSSDLQDMQSPELDTSSTSIEALAAEELLRASEHAGAVPMPPEEEPEGQEIDLSDEMSLLDQLSDSMDSTIQESVDATRAISKIDFPDSAETPAKSPSPAAGGVRPDVLEFGEDDQLLEAQLDAMLDDLVVGVEAVAPDPKEQTRRAKEELDSFIVDDDIEVSFEIEVDDEEQEASAAEPTPEQVETELSGLLNAFDQMTESTSQVSLTPQTQEDPGTTNNDSVLGHLTTSLAEEAARDDRPEADASGEAVDMKMLVGELTQLVAEAYGLDPDNVLAQLGAGAKAKALMPDAEEVDPLKSLEAELDRELMELTSEGTTFYHEDGIDPVPPIVEEPETEDPLKELEAELASEIAALEQEGTTLFSEEEDTQALEAAAAQSAEEEALLTELDSLVEEEIEPAEEPQIEAVETDVHQEEEELLAALDEIAEPIEESISAESVEELEPEVDAQEVEAVEQDAAAPELEETDDEEEVEVLSAEEEEEEEVQAEEAVEEELEEADEDFEQEEEELLAALDEIAEPIEESISAEPVEKLEPEVEIQEEAQEQETAAPELEETVEEEEEVQAEEALEGEVVEAAEVMDSCEEPMFVAPQAAAEPHSPTDTIIRFRAEILREAIYDAASKAVHAAGEASRIIETETVAEEQAPEPAADSVEVQAPLFEEFADSEIISEVSEEDEVATVLSEDEPSAQIEMSFEPAAEAPLPEAPALDSSPMSSKERELRAELDAVMTSLDTVEPQDADTVPTPKYVPRVDFSNEFFDSERRRRQEETEKASVSPVAESIEAQAIEEPAAADASDHMQIDSIDQALEAEQRARAELDSLMNEDLFPVDQFPRFAPEAPIEEPAPEAAVEEPEVEEAAVEAEFEESAVEIEAAAEEAIVDDPALSAAPEQDMVEEAAHAFADIQAELVELENALGEFADSSAEEEDPNQPQQAIPLEEAVNTGVFLASDMERIISGAQDEEPQAEEASEAGESLVSLDAEVEGLIEQALGLETLEEALDTESSEVEIEDEAAPSEPAYSITDTIVQEFVETQATAVHVIPPVDYSAEIAPLWASAEQELGSTGVGGSTMEFTISSEDLFTLECNETLDVLFDSADRELAASPGQAAALGHEELQALESGNIDNAALQRAFDNFAMESKALKERQEKETIDRIKQRREARKRPELIGIKAAPRWRRAFAAFADAVSYTTIGCLAAAITCFPEELQSKLVLLEPPSLVDLLPVFFPTLGCIVAAWVLMAAALSWSRGQTIGQKMFDIQLVSMKNKEVDLNEAFVFALSQLTTLCTLGFGNLLLLGKKKRALHDRMAKVWVARVDPERPMYCGIDYGEDQ